MKCKYYKCHAKWRVNHPHGKKSKGITIWIVGHSKKCPYKPKEEDLD